MRNWTCAALALALATFLAGDASPARAAVWTVAADGTGDFTVIQDALDAAKSGDTIRIRPGRYEDFKQRRTSRLRVQTIACIEVPDLRIEGAGPGRTILGPAQPVEEVDGTQTAAIAVDEACAVSISGLTVEGANTGIFLEATAAIANCRIGEHVTFGLWSVGGEELHLRDCTLVGDLALSTPFALGELLVEDCRFEGPSDHDYLAIARGRHSLLRRCTFLGGGIGVYAQEGTTEIENSTFEGLVFADVYCAYGPVSIRNCVLGKARDVLFADRYGVEVQNSMLAGGARYTIVGSDAVTLRNCQIGEGEVATVYCMAHEPDQELDLRYNWWGTSDLDLIASRIVYRYGTGSVLFVPIRHDVVPTAEGSVGRLKGRFLGGN